MKRGGKKNLCFFASLLLCFFVQQAVSSSQHSIFISSLGKQTKQKADSRKKENKENDKSENNAEKETIDEKDFQPVLIGTLLEKPAEYLDKKVKFRGRFSSFTTLALDYEPALRKSKDFISISVFRPDSMIPLSELKLAYPVEKAKEDQVIRELEEGDLVEINGQVFSAALDEPWIDIALIKKIESANKKDAGDKKIAREEEKDLKEKNTTDNKSGKTKKDKKEPKNK